MHDSDRVDIVQEKLDSWMGQVVDAQTKGRDGPVWAWGRRRWWSHDHEGGVKGRRI
jgi:hypothetical protein